VAAFPIKPYVDSAPVLDQPPAATDWGLLVRPIGTVDVNIEQPSLSTVTVVPLTIVAATLQAANPLRRGLFVFNDSNCDLYLKVGAAATVIDWSIRICSGAYFEFPFPATTQIITGIWAFAGTGSARVTELTVP